MPAQKFGDFDFAILSVGSAVVWSKVVLGGSGGRSKYAKNGDDWGYFMAVTTHNRGTLSTHPTENISKQFSHCLTSTLTLSNI